MQRVQYALSIVLFLTAPVLCHGQELQPGEIRLVGRISVLIDNNNQLFLPTAKASPRRRGTSL